MMKKTPRAQPRKQEREGFGMDLRKLYQQVEASLLRLDLGRIWPGFEPLRFALYDRDRCFFDGAFIEKTDAFCANTSIVYQGEQIAIWMVREELEIPVLTSKIVHEMFHGFQARQGWSCWPNELEALYRYEYVPGNLSLRLRENELLLALLDRFDEASFRELLSHRKLRGERYPYEFGYETRVEEIEGAANYVEWQVLKQLDEEKAAALEARMRRTLTDPRSLFPIRISSYFSGALMIHALRSAGVYPFDPSRRSVLLPILRNAEPSDGSFPGKDAAVRAVSEAVAAFQEETRAVVCAALEKNVPVLTGPCELAALNVYDARRYGDCLTTTFFLLCRVAGEERMLQGDFVIRMKDEKTIAAVYRWEKP